MFVSIYTLKTDEVFYGDYESKNDVHQYVKSSWNMIMVEVFALTDVLLLIIASLCFVLVIAMILGCYYHEFKARYHALFE